MFKSIVVGIDGREGGRDALALAAKLQQVFASSVVAAHAFPYDYHLGRSSDAALETAMHGAALKTLEGELEGCSIPVKPTAVPDSSPGRALQMTAQREHADLIVVGSAHRGPVGRVLAGDVTAGTLQAAPCPVLVAPAGYAQSKSALETIGVGFDGSPESRAAVELARDLAAATGARLRVVSVFELPAPAGSRSPYGTDWAEQAHRRREEAEQRVEDLVAELGDELASGNVIAGDAAEELANTGHDVDLLVVGSRRYGPLRRLLLGSTSRKLVHHAPCPVLVLPRGAEGDGQEAAGSVVTPDATRA